MIKNLYFLNKKYNKKIKIFLIDSINKTQEDKEKSLATNILKNLENKKTFAILGEVHASKKTISLNGLKIIPAGAILFNKLKEKIFIIRIMPLKGKFYNFGIKQIINSNLNETFNKNFDYVIEIEKTSACSFQK